MNDRLPAGPGTEPGLQAIWHSFFQKSNDSGKYILPKVRAKEEKKKNITNGLPYSPIDAHNFPWHTILVQVLGTRSAPMAWHFVRWA